MDLLRRLPGEDAGDAEDLLFEKDGRAQPGLTREPLEARQLVGGLHPAELLGGLDVDRRSDGVGIVERGQLNVHETGKELLVAIEEAGAAIGATADWACQVARVASRASRKACRQARRCTLPLEVLRMLPRSSKAMATTESS